MTAAYQISKDNDVDVTLFEISGSVGGLAKSITLWDQTRLSGQLDEPTVTCALASGISVKIPVPLIESYSQPQPQISSTTSEKVKSIVALLSADDWKQRDQAQNQLIAMGSAIAGTLRQMRAAQTPEAQQRIDEGWQFLAIGSELKMMLDGINTVVQKLGLGQTKKEMAKY